MIHALFLVLAPVATPQQPEAAQEAAENVLEVYDLRPVMPRFDGLATWSQSFLTSSADPYSERERASLGGVYQDEAPDVVLDLLAQVLGDELRYEGREIALEGESRLLVLAPPAVHARVRAALDALGAALSGTARMTVDVLSLKGESLGEWPAEGVLAVAQAERLIDGLLAKGATRRSYALSVGAGRTAGLDLTRREPFVFDYDVEIAQGSAVFDPVVVEAESGTRIFLRGVAVPGGVSLAVYFMDGDAGEVRDVQVKLRSRLGSEKGETRYAEGPAVVQQIDVLFRAAAFHTFVQDDKAIVFASHADVNGKRSRQIVVLRRTGGDLQSYHLISIPGSTRRILLANAEMMNPPTALIEQSTPSDDEQRHPTMTARVGAEPSLFFFDWIRGRFDFWRRVGPWAAVVTDPAWDDDAPQRLVELLTKWKPDTRLVTLDFELQARGGSSAAPVRWMLPVLAGTACGTMIGVTDALLYDYDVEVAQYAGVVDPKRRPLFNGLALSLRPSVRGDGSLSLDARGVAQLRSAPPRAVDLQGSLIGALELAGFDQLDVHERVSIPRSDDQPATVSFGDAAMQGQQPALRLDVRLR